MLSYRIVLAICWHGVCPPHAHALLPSSMERACSSINCAPAVWAKHSHPSAIIMAPTRTWTILLSLAALTAACDVRTFYTFRRDEHAPACYFHATLQTRCPNAPDDYLVSVRDAGGGDFLDNATLSPLQLSVSDCATQFRTRLYYDTEFDTEATAPVTTQLADRAHGAPYAASYPYIYINNKYAHGGTIRMEPWPSNDQITANLFLATHLTPLVLQAEQPHGVRPPDERDNTLAYALGIALGATAFLLVIVLIFKCKK